MVMVTICVNLVVHKGKLAAGSGRTCVLSLHGLLVYTEGVLSCSDRTPSIPTHPERWCRQQPTCDQSFLAANRHTQISPRFAAFVATVLLLLLPSQMQAASCSIPKQEFVITCCTCGNICRWALWQNRHSYNLPG